MGGLAVGTLCSAAMSMLGRVYRPGIRKNRVFAMMGAMLPMGFATGGLQGGAFSAHLEWIFGSTAIICAVCAVMAFWCIPKMDSGKLSIRNFDFSGAIIGLAGCGMLIIGLTQGAPTKWTSYTYALVIVGLACLAFFGFVESKVPRPLIDNRLWKVRGFLPLMLAYFLGFGGFCGAWQFYAVRFMLEIQHKPPIIVACCLIPVGITGMIASGIVGKSLHIMPGHYILIGSFFAFGLGPVFFLPQTAHTSYWALTFPGFILSTFGPDMSFAAISVFITSNVPRSYQGAAGSLLITVQNLAAAIMAAMGDTIASQVTKTGTFEIDLPAPRAVWWFSLGVCLLGAIICLLFVRIPKSEEGDFVPIEDVV